MMTLMIMTTDGDSENMHSMRYLRYVTMKLISTKSTATTSLKTGIVMPQTTMTAWQVTQPRPEP